MKIVIAGAGEVGFHLAKLLSRESQDIILIDTGADRLKYCETHLDVITIRGNATSIALLKEANVGTSDLLIAATSSETTNLTIAMLGKRLGVKRTIARVRNTEFIKLEHDIDFKSIGIDVMISPQDLAAKEIERLIEQSAFSDVHEFENGLLYLVGMTLEECGETDIFSLPLSQYGSKFREMEAIPVAIKRDTQTIIPHGDTVLQCEDNVYFITHSGGLDKLRKLSGKQEYTVDNIMILGGSQIGLNTAKILADQYNVKIIEQNKAKAFELADLLPNVMIINGDGRDVEMLEEEGLGAIDVFVAVTGNSETNIMSCLVAKNHGVKKTIALVENINYIDLSQNIGIDALLNKKMIAASTIFKYIRKAEIVSMKNIQGIDAEVMEFYVKEGNKICAAPIRNLELPKDAFIGGVVRDGKGIVTLGDFHVKPGDRVVVFCMPESLAEIESFFS